MENGGIAPGGTEPSLKDVLRAITSLTLKLEDFGHIIGEVADALLVPRVRRKIEGCLPTTAAFLYLPRAENTYAQCSAVPVPADAGLHIPGAKSPQNDSSTFFFTSAHCFFDEDNEWKPFGSRAVLIRAGAAHNVSHSCSLSTHLAFFDSGVPLDLVVIACSPPVRMPPSTFSSRPLLMHEPVALAGYSAGVHLQENFSVTVTGSHEWHNYALHGSQCQPLLQFEHPPGLL